MISRRQSGAAAVASVAALVAAAGAAPAASAGGFGGADLARPGIGVAWNGTAFPRVKCAGGTDGFCAGTVTILRGARVLGRAPFAVRSSDAPTVEVPLGPRRGGRRLAILAGARAVMVVIRAEDL